MGKRRAADDINKDRITALPTNLIQLILSRMPIREAARTSVLSRNWRHIWATDPTLYLGKKFFDDMFKNKLYSQYEFVKAIHQIFVAHIGPITTFILYIPQLDLNHHASGIDLWILAISRKGIKKLSLDNSNHVPYELPSYLFDCRELTHLDLHKCILKPPLAFKGFNKIIDFTLEEMTFSVDGLRALLLPSAPVLRRLYLMDCIGMEILRIQAPKLELLCVLNSRGFDWQIFETHKSLETVCVKLHNNFENPQQRETINLVKLFGNLRKIRKLQLDGFSLKFLAAAGVPKRLPNMNDQLTCLYLCNFGFNDRDHVCSALCLLRSSPNLQTLEIDGVKISNEPAEIINDLVDPRCMEKGTVLNKLRTVKLSYLNGLKAELLFTKLVLSHSPLLESLIIEVRNDIDASEELRISRELLHFSRASPRAKIIYSIYNVSTNCHWRN